MKKTAFLFLALPLLLALILSASVLPFLMPGVSAESDGTVIESYKKTVRIDGSMTMTVNETLDVILPAGAEGYTHRIQEDTGYRTDGKGNIIKSRAKLALFEPEISVKDGAGDVPFVSHGKSTVNVSFAAPLQEEKVLQFIFQYRADLPLDEHAGFDSFYTELLPYRSNAKQISNVSFSLYMPKGFDFGKVDFRLSEGLFAGNLEITRVYAAQTEEEPDAQRVLSFDAKLVIPQGVTLNSSSYIGLAFELPDGYFAKRYFWGLLTALIVSTLIVPLSAFIIWKYFGKQHKAYDKERETPPSGVTPAELGMLVDGKVADSDIVSLLAYWADKGCIAIKDEWGTDPEYFKLADLPEDAKPFERTLFNGMFSHARRVYDTDEAEKDAFTKFVTDEKTGSRLAVRVSALAGRFSNYVYTAKKQVRAEYEKDDRRIYTKKSSNLQKFSFFFISLPVIMLCFSLGLLTNSVNIYAGLAAFAALFAFSVPFSDAWIKRRLPQGKIKLALSVTLIFSVYAGLFVWGYFNGGGWVTGVVIFGAGVMHCIALIFAEATKQRTEFADGLLGETLGLLDFVDNAGKLRLEQLTEEDAGYFLHILPYAYALGVTDAWFGKFEKFGLEKPVWYNGGKKFEENFSVLQFKYRFLNTMRASLKMGDPPPKKKKESR